MRNFFCLSLSRFAHASTAALIMLVFAGAARADTLKVFDVSGKALAKTHLGICAEGETCSFSGTLTIDMTIDRITAIDIIFKGLPAFDGTCCFSQGPVSGTNDMWEAESRNHAGHRLFLEFTTRHTPGSLVGFDGGRITGTEVFIPVTLLYTDLHGSIEPTTTPVIPEPGTLGMLGTGLIGLAGMARRKLKRPM